MAIRVMQKLKVWVAEIGLDLAVKRDAICWASRLQAAAYVPGTCWQV